MPELPEVETIRRDLRRGVLNKKIIHVEVRRPSTVRSDRCQFVRWLKARHCVLSAVPRVKISHEPVDGVDALCRLLYYEAHTPT